MLISSDIPSSWIWGLYLVSSERLEYWTLNPMLKTRADEQLHQLQPLLVSGVIRIWCDRKHVKQPNKKTPFQCLSNCFPIVEAKMALLALHWSGNQWRLRQQCHKNPQNSDTWKICCNQPKILTMWLYHWEMCPKDVDQIANSVDPDQTGAVRSGLHYLPRPICPKT